MSQAAPPERILAVIVLYRQTPASSQSLQSLLAAREFAGLSPDELPILLADNTPGGQPFPALPAGVSWAPYPTNPGLAQPYNDALARARADGIPWLLTLDQDTDLPPNFLVELGRAMIRFRENTALATIVPRIFDGARQVSPLRFLGGFLPRIGGPGQDGYMASHASAINSAALHRVAALETVGGFSPLFPLHNSDSDLFLRLARAGKRLAVADGLTVQHQFSMMARSDRMSPERYRQNLEDECRFWDLRMPFLGRLERLLRLVLRALLGAITREDPALQRVTLGEIRRRLRVRRPQRLRHYARTPLAPR